MHKKFAVPLRKRRTNYDATNVRALSLLIDSQSHLHYFIMTKEVVFH